MLCWTTRAEYSAIARTPFAVLRVKAEPAARPADVRYAVLLHRAFIEATG